jgi:hypothetical protein
MGLRFEWKRFKIKNHDTDLVFANIAHYFRQSPVLPPASLGFRHRSEKFGCASAGQQAAALAFKNAPAANFMEISS